MKDKNQRGMNPELLVIMEELILIRDNTYGGLKNESSIHLTHSEVISFARTFVNAVKSETINPFWGWTSQNKTKVMFYMNLIRTPGIPHCDRSRAAKKCLEVISQKVEEEMQAAWSSTYPTWSSTYPGGSSTYPGEEPEPVPASADRDDVDWDDIPF